jgi:hypothetical protein
MYVKTIKQNTKDSHQTSPSYVLTFIRWNVRDTLNTDAEPFDVRKPLVVYNDATNIRVSMSKSSKTPTMSATLMGGDINYSTAVHPGDLVFVNILDWGSHAVKVAEKAFNLQPINGIHDGFKGFFKVQAVTRNLVTSEDGHKTYYYTVSAAGFTEFDSTYLYNPAIQDAFKQDAQALFMSLVGEYYSDKLKQTVSIETILQDLFQILIGKSPRSNNVKVPNYGNLHYRIPTSVGQLLGKKDAKYVCDIYNLITGIWSGGSKSAALTESSGFNPNITPTSETANIYNTNIPLQGWRIIAPENWNYKTVWSILNDNLNNTLNEMYVSYRISPDSNSVMPTIIARQKPFSNPNFVPPAGYSVTKFTELPRWKITPEMVKSAQFYKNEALRTNFVQVFTRNLAELTNENMATNIAERNFVQDAEDIQRHGLKPYITTSNFDFPVNGDVKVRAKEWTQIVADWVINGHLKEAGTIQCVGIEEPIAVGDNIEFDNVVYHIESIDHVWQIMRNGNKQFITNINVSYGIDLRSNSSQIVFTEMERTDRYTKGVDDYKYEKILPGISDSQDIFGRTQGEELKNTKETSFLIPNKKRQEPPKGEGNL